MVHKRFVRMSLFPALSGLCCLAGAGVALVVAAKEEPGLAAASNHNRYDSDRDGLTDLQELVIGTYPYRMDSDSDGFSDLEECARGSDPMDAYSYPETNDFSVGTCGSQEDGYVSCVSAVYLNNTQVSEVSLEIGFVYRGVVYHLPSNVQSFSRAFIYPSHNSQDTLALIEIGVPEGIVQRLGQLSIFSVLRSTSTAPVDPVASIMTLKNMDGVIVSVEQRVARVSNTSGGATGLVYRPLAAGDRIPTQWEGGLVCFERTNAVGWVGVSVEHSIESSSCVPMDTYCNHAACSAAQGQSIQLPDPGALIGG